MYSFLCFFMWIYKQQKDELRMTIFFMLYFFVFFYFTATKEKENKLNLPTENNWTNTVLVWVFVSVVSMALFINSHFIAHQLHAISLSGDAFYAFISRQATNDRNRWSFVV